MSFIWEYFSIDRGVKRKCREEQNEWFIPFFSRILLHQFCIKEEQVSIDQLISKK